MLPRATLGRAKLWESTLSQLPERQVPTLAGQADGPTTAGALFSGDFYSAPVAEDVGMRNQNACYKALFDCGSQTIIELASGKRFIGSDRLGFFGALHTWGRDFTTYNPHVHFVVPGGGVSADGSKWMACPENFLLPEKAASPVFPGKFRDAMREAGLEQEFKATDAKAWLGKWTVNVEPVGNGEAALKYLAPYVYRVAISNNRIESVDETDVRFRYTPSGTKVSSNGRSLGRSLCVASCSTRCPRDFIASVTTVGLPELQTQIPLAADAGLVLSGLVLVDEKAGTGGSPRETTRSLSQVRRRNAVGRSDRRRRTCHLQQTACQPRLGLSRFGVSPEFISSQLPKPKPTFLQSVCKEVSSRCASRRHKAKKCRKPVRNDHLEARPGSLNKSFELRLD